MRLPFPVVLASGSPRRRDLLKQVVEKYSIEVSQVDEVALTVEDPWETAQLLSSAKANAVAEARARRGAPTAIVIGGDTVVALPGPMLSLQLSKPTDEDDAVAMLKLLAGRRHAVITAIAIVSPFTTLLASDTAWVTFRELSDREVREYVATGEPMDKAGGYAIQGGAKGFVKQLEGDVETVIGLPTSLIRSMLDDLVQRHPPALD